MRVVSVFVVGVLVLAMYWMDLLNVCAVLYLIGLGLSRGCR